MLSYTIRSNPTRRKVADTFVLQHRLRHQPPNRTIKVQLLTDVQGLGRLGSIQNVAPGRMRSVLHPQKKAVYLLKNATPLVAQGNGVPLSLQEEVDFANIKSRLETLAPLVFRRSLLDGHSLRPPSAKGKAICGSVTLQDVAERLNESHNLFLVPPDAVLTFQEKNMRGKIRMTGSFMVLVRLRTGDEVPLTLLVEPEVASTKQTEPLQGTTLVSQALV